MFFLLDLLFIIQQIHLYLLVIYLAETRVVYKIVNYYDFIELILGGRNGSKSMIL